MDGERGRLQRQVRGWLAEGRLPRPRAELWVGPGSGQTCAICARSIHHAEIEYEVPNDNGWLSVHLDCFSLWKAEAASVAAQPRGGPHAAQPATLGGLLFGENCKPCESEADWTALVREISQGDRLALHALYRRMQWPVFTFMEKVTHDRETAADLTANVFHEVWRQASVTAPAGGSVAGWVMSLARALSTDRLRSAERETPAANPIPDVRHPAATPWERLARRIALETGESAFPVAGSEGEPEWDHAAPGILDHILARDTENERVSMLVRLAPGAAYPAHTHAGVEELYLLDGELLIDSRQLSPGDYYRAEAGSGDQHVWSETGCTCVLLTSTMDILR